MKKALLILLVSLALPLAAWANSSGIVFDNTGGKLTLGAGNSLSLHTSALTSFTGLTGVTVKGTLGIVSFTTGALFSGSIGGGGIFAAGGSFTIKANGTQGLPSGVLFQGTFTGPATWSASFNKNGNGGKGAWTYVLSGSVEGTLNNGASAHGGTVQFTFDVSNGNQFFKTVRLKNGVTNVTVPEPGTLGLFGTGMFMLAGLIRRKLSTTN